MNSKPPSKRPVDRLPDWLKQLLIKAWSPAHTVGNTDRVRSENDLDSDEERLGELNKQFQAMLDDDPWRKRLMVHVRLLSSGLSFFAIVLLACVTYFPAKHPLISLVLAVFAGSLPYWVWIGVWNKRIVERVFEKFKTRYGKFFHLK
jgi:hypothetical protein